MKFETLVDKKVTALEKYDYANRRKLAIAPYIALATFIIEQGMVLLFKKDEQSGDMVYDKVKWWQVGRLFSIVRVLIEIVKRTIKII